jgi:hypothetical protein
VRKLSSAIVSFLGQDRRCQGRGHRHGTNSRYQAASDTSGEYGAPPVNTESGDVSTVVDCVFADDLPLNGGSLIVQE